jgi:hypothetical protein
MIWSLKRRDINPKSCYINENIAVIVRAETEADARYLASTEHGDEGPIWDDPDRVDCVPIESDGFPPMVLNIETG